MSFVQPSDTNKHIVKKDDIVTTHNKNYCLCHDHTD